MMIDDVLQPGDIMVSKLAGSRFVWCIVTRVYEISCHVTFMTANGTLVPGYGYTRDIDAWDGGTWTLIRCDDV